jgi:sugar/nucleoside kinase (ribokinase family)
MAENEHGNRLTSLQIVGLLKKRKKILCIGDLLIDVVFKGERHELAHLEGMQAPPHIAREYEAILDCNSFNVYPGGAAGLARYLQALGNDVTLISTYGWSDEKDKTKYAFTKTLSCGLIDLLKEAGVDCNSLAFVKDRPTPVKIYAYYPISQSPFFKWIPRIDLEGHEARLCVSEKVTQELLGKIPNLDQFDAIVLEDNAKGLLSQVGDDLAGPSQFAEVVIKKLEHYTGSVFVDPRSHWDFFRSLKVHSILPDHCFATRATKRDPAALPKDRDQLMSLLKQYAEEIFDHFDLVDNFVIKCEQYGVLAVLRDKTNRYDASCWSLPAWRVSACSTVGCGDTFDAYYIALVMRKIDPRVAIKWANLAGGLRAEKGMEFFPAASKLEEGLRSLRQTCPKFEKMPFESKISKILARFKREICLNDCVLVRIDNQKKVMARDGAMLKMVCEIIEKLQKPQAKVLLYGPSRSGKSTIIGAVLQALSGNPPKAFGKIDTLSQNYFENKVSGFTDVDNISSLLALGEKWEYPNSNGEVVDLSSQKILFDTSLVEDVEKKRTDLCAREIRLFWYRPLGEDKDALLDAAFFIGDLLSDAKLNVERRVFTALLAYPYGPGQGWNKLEEMVKAAIESARKRNGDSVTKEDLQYEIYNEDVSFTTVSPRTRSKDNLLNICRNH